MNFLLGAFGSGKTSYILKKMIALEKQNEDFWTIVPGQLQKHSLQFSFLKFCKGFAGNKILTISELQEQIFRTLQSEIPGLQNSLSNFEQFLYIVDIIQDKSTQFLKFKNIEERPELIKQIYRTVQEIRNISKIPENFDKKSHLKLHDIDLIIREYENRMQKDMRGDNAYEIELIKEFWHKSSQFFLPQHIFLDGFIDFTKPQFEFIEYILFLANSRQKTSYISITTMDNSFTKKQLALWQHSFSYAKKIEIFSQTSNCIAEHFLNNFVNLSFNSIKLNYIESIGRYQEIEEISNQIKKLCLYKEHNFADILIITKSRDRYFPIISSIFKKSKIPYFFGKDSKLLDNPIICFIYKCLKIIKDGLDHRNLDFLAQSNYIKSDIKIILTKTLEELKIPVHGRKSEWLGAIRKQMELNGEKESDIDMKWEAIKITITDLCDCLFHLDPDKKYPSFEYINQIKRIFNFFEIENSLAKMENTDDLSSKINETIKTDFAALKKLCDILKTFLDTMLRAKRENIKFSTFLFFFRSIVEETRYQNDIPGIDSVHILSPEDSKGLFFRSVFIIGMNESEYPSPPKHELFSLQEKKSINSLEKKTDQRLWQSETEYFAKERLYFSLALSRAKENLFFSRTPISEKGTYLGSSHFLDYILEKSEDITMIPGNSKKKSKDLIIRNLDIFQRSRQQNEYFNSILLPTDTTHRNDIQDMLKYYKNLKEGNILFEKNMTPPEDIAKYFGYLSEKNPAAEQFRKHEIEISVTGIERFGRCRYKGLWHEVGKLRKYELPRYTLEHSDYGQLYHKILEEYIKKANPIQIKEIDRHFLREILNREIAQNRQIEMLTNDFNYIYTILVSFLENTNVLSENFTPVYFEAVSGQFPLVNRKISIKDKQLSIRAQIDRIDQENSTKSFLILDYKKGKLDHQKKYIEIPFHLFQGFLYAKTLETNKLFPIDSISYLSIEKHDKFSEFPFSKKKKEIFLDFDDYKSLKTEELYQLLSILSSGNFSPFTQREEIGIALFEKMEEKFGSIKLESTYKCQYCEFTGLCLRAKKLKSSF